MTLEEFEAFVLEPGIEWFEDEEHFNFRDKKLPWYCKDQKRCLMVKKERMKDLTVDDLRSELRRGLNVSHITRITGYFSVVSRWNPGKLGELKERARIKF